jgi:hypothetical protein
MKHTSIFFVYSLLLVLAGGNLTFAHEEPPVPLPDNEVELCRATYDQQYQTASIERRDDKLSDFVVVYLVSESDPTDELSAQSVRESQPDVHVVTNWEDFLVIDEVTPVQAVFIHRSALPMADKEWFHDAYRRGVAMITIDMTFGEYSALVGDNCTFKKFADEGPAGGNPMTLDPKHYYIQSIWVMFPFNKEDTDRVSEAELLTCKPNSVKDVPYWLSQLDGFDMVRDVDSLFRVGLSAGKVEQEAKVAQYIQELQTCLNAATQE